MPARAPIPRRHILRSLLATAALAGCSSPSPRLYVLTPMPSNGNSIGSRGNRRSIGVQPVAMPEYLDRSEIVTYASVNELAANRDDRWAERLPSNVTRVLAENLSILLATDRAYVMPSRSGERPDYEVNVEFERFERSASRESVLDAQWTIHDGATRKVLVRDQTRLASRVPDNGYTSLVAAMNDSLTLLSRDIARAIASLPQKGGRRANS